MTRASIFLMLLVSLNCAASTQLFKITPNVKGPRTLVHDQQGTYVYQITNNTRDTLDQIIVNNLPRGVSIVANAGTQYCTFPVTLTSKSNCLVKLNINSNQTAISIFGGPDVCHSASKPIYCSKPARDNELSTEIIHGPIPASCKGNESNFNYELTQNFDVPPVDRRWGPNRNQLFLSSSNPNLTGCTTTDITNTENIQWMQKRVISAEHFWVKQKINYCHHHVTDYSTPVEIDGVHRTSIKSGGGYCSNELDMHPKTVYYKKQVRWNYSGEGSETADNWVNNNAMWYGVDCSDFTSFIYNFAFGIQFNSDTGYQAGQKSDGSQNLLTPNGQTVNDPLQVPPSPKPYDSPAGRLVCLDGTVEGQAGATCTPGNQLYLSVFSDATEDPSTHKVKLHRLRENIDDYLGSLLPGDLIYLGFPPGSKKGSGNNPNSVVTHVVTWTGKKVGYGADDIHPDKIAPESICPNSWQPSVGDWVIIDSHYQGPDYRIFSNCFYSNNVWGVRRVIGYMD